MSSCPCNQFVGVLSPIGKCQTCGYARIDHARREFSVSSAVQSQIDSLCAAAVSTLAPAPAPKPSSNPWQELKNHEGRTYYYNKETKESSWSVPPELESARATAEQAKSSAAVAAPVSSAVQSQIDQICDMGFERSQVELCMRAAFNNGERAVEYLMNGIPANVQAAASAVASSAVSAAAMSAGDCLFISGATGLYAGAINGGYGRTGDICGGYVLYRKRCDPGIIMEHHDGMWQVKGVSGKGTAVGYAYVAGGCAAEACTSRMWKESFESGSRFHDAPSVKMVAGAEAQRQVERRCMRALQHPPPPPPPRVQLLPLTCCAFLHRLLLKRRPFQTTTRELLPCSSAALQVPMLLQSTVFSNRRRRRGRMAVLCTSTVPITTSASSTSMVSGR